MTVLLAGLLLAGCASLPSVSPQHLRAYCVIQAQQMAFTGDTTGYVTKAKTQGITLTIARDSVTCTASHVHVGAF